MVAGDPVNTRKPGDFYRHQTTGAPYVNHPTDTTKTGKPRRVMYGRPSSFGTALDNPYNLLKWRERQLLIGAQAVGVGMLDIDPDDRAALDALAAYCHEAAGSSLAAERGTHVHLLCQYHDEGKTWGTLLEAGVQLGIPLLLQCTIVEQWAAFRQRMGVTALAIEATVVNDRWRLAGTLDRLDVCDHDLLTGFGVIEASESFVGDIKTGGLTIGNDGQPNYWVRYPVQLAAYVDAVPYNTDTDEREDWPAPPNPHIAIIYHYDLARALAGEVVDWHAIPVSVDAGRDGGNLCRAAADFGKRRDLFAMPAPATTLVVGPQSTTAKGGVGTIHGSFTSSAPIALPIAAVEQQTTGPVPASLAGSVVEYSADPADECTCSSLDYATALNCPIHGPIEYSADRDRLIARIKGLVDAGHIQKMRLWWPIDVPTLKHDGHTAEQLAQILKAVRRVESEVGAQFHADDMHSAQFQHRRRGGS